MDSKFIRILHDVYSHPVGQSGNPVSQYSALCSNPLYPQKQVKSRITSSIKKAPDRMVRRLSFPLDFFIFYLFCLLFLKNIGHYFHVIILSFVFLFAKWAYSLFFLSLLSIKNHIKIHS